MAKESSFWHWYARVNDDVRHQLIDRMWFNQHQRDNAFERDVQAMAGRAEEGPSPPDATVHTHDPHVPEALEGIGARSADDFNAENVKSVMEEYYGRNRPPEKDAAERARERDQAMQDFYRRRDLEQER